MNPQKTSDLSVVRELGITIIDGRLTTYMYVSPHPYAFYQMRYMDRIAVTFGGGGRLDCCNGRLCGVADSQLHCFTAFSWYKTRDLHCQYANKLVVFNCTKPIALRIL